MKVLIAEDEDVSRLWLESVLAAWGYDVITALDGNEAWHILQQHDAPRLAIIDWQMPGMDGPEICRKLKAELPNHFCYTIMLTSKSSSTDLIEALQAGAEEFISKPFNPEELRVRIRAGARIVELQQQLLERASHDHLTGVFNRWMLMEMAQREFDRCIRDEIPVSLLLLDIDHFKDINDSYGHPTGDAVLTVIANRIKDAIRTIDVLGRYGGEEFMLMLPQCAVKTAKSVAERIRNSLSINPIVTSGHTLTVTASVGVSSISGRHPKGQINDLPTLIKRADEALYRAKRGGRNRVEVEESE